MIILNPEIEFPKDLIKEIESIFNRRNYPCQLILEDYQKIEEEDKFYYRIRFICPRRNFAIWAGFRLPLESQLIDGGVILPILTPHQERIVKELELFFDEKFNFSDSCYKYYLFGLLDRFLEQRKISNTKYWETQKKIRELPDRFSSDAQWYFGKLPDTDNYKDLYFS